MLADFGQAAFRLDRMARKVPTAAPWEARRAEDWDAQTFETWVRRNLRTKHGRSLMKGVVEAVWACSPPTSRSCTSCSTSTPRVAPRR